MIQRKTYKADIDRQRPRLYLISLAIVLAVGAVVLNFRMPDVASLLPAIDDEEITMDLDALPPLKDDGFRAAPDAKHIVSDQINKVDMAHEQAMRQAEELKTKLVFKPSETDAAELQESEAEPMETIAKDLDGNDLPLRTIEELPEFPGGMSEFVKWLNNALRYPQRAINSRHQGTVVVTFIVEKDGTTSHIKFERQTHTSVDAEVLRVLKMMPKWKPATDHGRPCRAMISLPVVFAL